MPACQGYSLASVCWPPTILEPDLFTTPQLHSAPAQFEEENLTYPVTACSMFIKLVKLVLCFNQLQPRCIKSRSLQKFINHHSNSSPAVVVVGAVAFVVVAVDAGVVVVVPEQDLDECVHVNLVLLFYWLLLIFGDYGKIWNMMYECFVMIL